MFICRNLPWPENTEFYKQRKAKETKRMARKIEKLTFHKRGAKPENGGRLHEEAMFSSVTRSRHTHNKQKKTKYSKHSNKIMSSQQQNNMAQHGNVGLLHANIGDSPHGSFTHNHSTTVSFTSHLQVAHPKPNQNAGWLTLYSLSAWLISYTYKFCACNFIKCYQVFRPSKI